MAESRRGFTLIELLIFSGIFALIVGAFITILVGTVSVQSSQSAQNEVATQGQALVQQIQYYIQAAKFVDMPLDVAQNTLVLREATSSQDPTIITSLALPAVVQTSTLAAYSAKVVSDAFTNNVTANDLIIGFVQDGPTYASATVTNVSSTCATINFTATTTPTEGLAWFYGIANQTGPCTVSAAGVNTGLSMNLEEVSGISTSSPVDTSYITNYAYGATIVPAAPLTTNAYGDYVFGWESNNNAAPASAAGPGFKLETGINSAQYTEDLLQQNYIGYNNVYFTMASTTGQYDVGSAAMQALASSTVYLQIGNGVRQALNGNRVSVSNLSFTRHFNVNSTSSPYGIESVSYSFTVTSQGGQESYSQTFSSSALILNPISAAILLQHAQTEQNSGTSASIAAGYPRAIEKGDLLVAVTANSSAATSSVTDSVGNIYKLAASSTYANYTSTVAIFYAANATSGAATATAAFGGSGGKNPSLFLFEYRGIATTTALDVAGSQLQPNTLTPSTTAISPNGGLDLLFAVDNDVFPTNVTASAGNGYSMEASSTGGYSTQVFIEDSTQYIDTPAAATWTLSGNASSSATIVSFPVAGIADYTSGLVAEWNYENNLNDSTGNGYTGTWSGTSAYSTGQVGAAAVTFNGSNNLSISPDLSALNNATSFTIAAWVKPANVTNQSWFAKQSGSDWGHDILLGFDTSDNIFIQVDNGADGSNGLTLPSALFGTWFHVTVVYDGTQSTDATKLKIYVNGVLQAPTFTYTVPTTSAGISGYGQYISNYAGGYHMVGSVDDERIYSRPLTQAQVTALYNSEK